jgi:hypothetical protein
MDVLQKIAQLEARLQELEDREQIRNLIAGYGPAVDSGDSALAAAQWSEDGRYDVGGMGVSLGWDQIAALFDGETHQGLIAGGAAHVLSPLHIEIMGEQAAAVGYSCVFVWDIDSFRPLRVAANRWRLERRDGGWIVLERVNRLLNGQSEARELLRPPR